MQPADVQVDPWVWVPLSRRRGWVLPTVIATVFAAAVGYGLGRHSNVGDIPQSQTVAGPSTSPGLVQAKSEEERAKPDLALKSDSEAAKHLPVPAQTRPDTPAVRLLNPGTADPQKAGKGATARESRAAPAGTSQPTARSDAAPTKPSG